MIFANGNAAMARKITPKQISSVREFWLRLLSITIGVPAVLWIQIQGTPYVDALVFCALFLMLREWTRLSASGTHQILPHVLLIEAALIFYGSLFPFFVQGLLSALSVCAIIFALRHMVPFKDFRFFLMGGIYICTSMMIFLSFAKGKPAFQFFALWTILLVWITDIGAYVVGRLVGGAKLAPRVSPNKTWSGFCGGIILAMCVTPQLVSVCGIQDVFKLSVYVVAGLLSVCAHVGDLLESGAKRFFGVKDSGSLIPGHGGLLDRLDSLLMVNLGCGILLLLGLIR